MSAKSERKKRIRFNMRAVPRSERSNETLLEMADEYAEKLNNREWRRALCIHEAAHAIYAEQFGSERAIFEAPLAFFYDESDDSFTLKEAQVWTDVPRYWRDDVKHLLAGEIAEKELVGADWSEDAVSGSEAGWLGGSAGDYFHILAALRRGRIPKAKHKQVLKKVESEIRRDLRKPVFRRAIIERAKQYQRVLEQRIFGAGVRVSKAA